VTLRVIRTSFVFICRRWRFDVTQFRPGVLAGQALGALAGGILGDRFSVITVLNGQAILYLLAGALALAVLRTAGAPGQTGRAAVLPAAVLPAAVLPAAMLPAAMIQCPSPVRLGSRRPGNIDSGRTGF
jgi:hypothetical protein